MNFLEKKLQKQVARHFVEEFRQGHSVSIPDVGTARYDSQRKVIVVEVTPGFAASIQKAE